MLLAQVRDLDEAVTPERFVRPAGCAVLWADPAMLRHDFGVEGDPASLERWLLANAAWVSMAQCANDAANLPIPLGDGEATGFRPPHYGRAAIFRVEAAAGGGAGLIDVKGCGVRHGLVPERAFHSTGLLPVRTAVREVVMQRIVERVFASLGVPIRGVPVYAVLRLGFDARLRSAAGAEPAALLVRRAHRRPPGNVELPAFSSGQHRAKLLVELILRRVGITSASPQGRLVIGLHETGRPWLRIADEDVALASRDIRELVDFLGDGRTADCDVINVQTTRQVDYPSLDIELVDFGQYFPSREPFTRPLLSLVADLPFSFGCVFRPGEIGFAQADPGLALPDAQFAHRALAPELAAWGGLAADAQVDGLTAFVMELARAVSRQETRRPEIERRIDTFVADATAPLAERARSSEEVEAVGD